MTQINTDKSKTTPRASVFTCVLILLLIVAALLAGCDNAGTSPAPTATFVWPTALPASPTVNPVAPAVENHDIRDPGLGEAGVSDPTKAALAAEGEPDQPLPTVTPLPTDATLPLVISAGDGLVLQATLYGAAVRPAPGVLLLHMESRDRTSWDDLPERLQARGYAVLVIDQRGHGSTGGAVDWALALDDIRAAMSQLAELPGINPAQIAVIGAGIGANLGLNACVDTAGCVGAVLLSPGLDTRSITTADAMARIGFRPVLIIASENDANNPADSITLNGLATGPHELILYPAAGHGTDMFAAEPGLADRLIDWLAAQLPPP
ncbi:MAG: alpha/beta fold hydrolase [Anaerolineae bacterium]|nr:alpha/beta fold hydrolase [Anaerolineae bacterium]